jgi:hypothetical protein
MMRCLVVSLFAAGIAAFSMLPARAEPVMTCARAQMLEANSPGIETQSLMSIIAQDWQTMDQATVARGDAPVAPAMLKSNIYFNMISTQCTENPGQPLHAAAAQVYRQARMTLDGF